LAQQEAFCKEAGEINNPLCRLIAFSGELIREERLKVSDLIKNWRIHILKKGDPEDFQEKLRITATVLIGAGEFGAPMSRAADHLIELVRLCMILDDESTIEKESRLPN
jgi:hypothetical protein